MLDSVKATVERAGLGMDDVVSVTVYCSDLKLYDTFNAVYKGYFHANYPARAFIGVAQLVRGAHFEVQGIAVKGTRAGQPSRPSEPARGNGLDPKQRHSVRTSLLPEVDGRHAGRVLPGAQLERDRAGGHTGGARQRFRHYAPRSS